MPGLVGVGMLADGSGTAPGPLAAHPAMSATVSATAAACIRLTPVMPSILAVATALGAEARFLQGLGDGTLAATPQAPDSPARGFLDQFADAYLDVMPDLVLTWGPDGGYGHADHRMVSALTVQAVQSLEPEIRARLLHVGIPNGSLPPVAEMSSWATTDPALLTETIAYTPADLAAANAAALCHATQFDEPSRRGMMGLFDATMWRGRVHFRPGF